MIPVRDVIPTRTTPIVTIALVIAHVLLIAYLALGERTGAAMVYVALNALFLWLFGGTVEDRVGHMRFLVLCLLCSAAAAMVQARVPSPLLVRLAVAAGATAGVIGAYFVLYPRSRIVTLVPMLVTVQVVEVPAAYVAGFWFAIQLAVAMTGAWIAGLATGMAAVVALRRKERLRVEWWDVISPAR